MLQLLRPNSSNSPCLCSTFRLEYPLVLSRFSFYTMRSSPRKPVIQSRLSYATLQGTLIKRSHMTGGLLIQSPYIGWLVVLRINVDLAIFQPYLDLEAGGNQYLKIQVARPGIEPRSSCSASQELNHSATAAPQSWDDRDNDREVKKCMTSQHF